MKSILVLALILMGEGIYAAPRTMKEIRRSGELRICFTPWRGSDTEADYQSPYVELAEEFAKKLKLKPKVSKNLWQAAFEDSDGKVKEGQTYTPKLFDTQACDIIANNMSHLDWRLKLMKINWIASGRNVVVVKKSRQSEFKSLNDLKGKTTVVVPNTTYHLRLLDLNKEFGPNEKIKIREKPAGGTLTELTDGKVDFVIIETTQAMFALAHLTPDISWSMVVGRPEKAGWGFPKDATELAKLSDDFLAETRKKPESNGNNIFKKYFGVTLNDYDNLQYVITNP